MRRRFALLALAAMAACRAQGTSPVPEARADEPAPPRATDGVAVLELFTSEGCSSCPAADALLARLAGRPGVYALSFHVDYWDDLGWRDRFATPGNTARQGAYARALGERGLYTPQLVVGGAEGFVGSDADHAEASVSRSLALAPGVRLAVHARTGTASEVLVEVRVTGATVAPADSVLNVALVERAVTSEVRAGENGGKTLHHANVVRSFASSPLRGLSGAVTLGLPPALRPDDADVIAYVQRAAGAGAGLPVLGAASAHVDPHE